MMKTMKMGSMVMMTIQAARDQGEKKVVLETSCHQSAAMKFYYKTGWTEVKYLFELYS